MEIKEDESCRIQKSSSLCGLTFFLMSFTKGTFYCLALPFNTDEKRAINFKRIESLLLILKTLAYIP